MTFKKLNYTAKFISVISLLSCSSALAEKMIVVVSPDGPIKTLEAARQEVRELKKQQPGKAIEVQIKGGLYELRETVVFGPEDSGTQAAPVTYKAYPGETPVFTGGIKIENWQKVKKDPEGVSEQAKGKLWVAQIPETTGETWYIRSLYDGEKLLARATSGALRRRTPDQARKFDLNTHGIGIFKAIPNLEYEGDLLGPFEKHIDYTGDDIRDWDNLYDIEVIVRDRPWLRNIIPLGEVDVKNKTFTMAATPTYQPSNTSQAYWIENAIDYLDEPGEWVENTKEGLIYMWPESDIAGMDIVAPYLQEFIRVEGSEDDGSLAKHLHFEGLTFMHGARDTMMEGDKGLQHDWEMYDKGNAVLRFRYAENCSLKNSIIKSSSGTGIRLDLHCQNNDISSNHLKNLGAGGIVLSGYGPGTKDVNKNNIVHDNYIHHIGVLLTHSAGIFIAQSGNNKITHNTIHDLPYNGIVVSGCRSQEFYLVKRIPFRREWIPTIRFEEAEPFIKKGLASKRRMDIDHFLPLLHARENVIADNNVWRVLLQLHDGNAIYFSAMGENNVVERNYLHKNYHTAGAIRLDNDSAFTIIKNNVIAEAEAGIGIKHPADITNNFIFTETFMRGIAVPGWLGGMKQAFPRSNIFMPPATSKSSNGLYLTSTKAKEKPFYLNLPKMENSIYFTLNQSKPYVPKSALGTDLVTGKPVTPGKDKIKLLYADPMFDEDAMKQGIFRFKKGSVAEQMGIQPIDLRGVGSSLASRDFSGFEVSALTEQPPVRIVFNNGSAFDDAPDGTSMVVEGMTMTSVELKAGDDALIRSVAVVPSDK